MKNIAMTLLIALGFALGTPAIEKTSEPAPLTKGKPGDIRW